MKQSANLEKKKPSKGDPSSAAPADKPCESECYSANGDGGGEVEPRVEPTKILPDVVRAVSPRDEASKGGSRECTGRGRRRAA